MIESDISDLYERINTLESLVVSLLTDEQIAQTEDANILRAAITDRCGVEHFSLIPPKLVSGTGWIVTYYQPHQKRGTAKLSNSVVAYVLKLKSMGMNIDCPETENKVSGR